MHFGFCFNVTVASILSKRCFFIDPEQSLCNLLQFKNIFEKLAAETKVSSLRFILEYKWKNQPKYDLWAVNKMLIQFRDFSNAVSN